MRLYSVSYTNGQHDDNGSCSTFRTRREAETARGELVRDHCLPGPVVEHGIGQCWVPQTAVQAEQEQRRRALAAHGAYRD